MTLMNMLAVNTLSATVFGIAFVLFPAQIMSFYEATLPPQGLVVAQLLGAVLIGVGILTWRARLLAESDTQLVIVPGLLVGNGISVLVLFLMQMRGPATLYGWLTTLLYVLLAAGYGYFYFGRSGQS